MKSTYSIIKSLIQTEKSTTLYEPQNKYLFLVEKTANKKEIKDAVEQIYKVKVEDVNTIIYPGKKKRVRYHIGRTPDYKRAIVTLKTGHKIEVA